MRIRIPIAASGDLVNEPPTSWDGPWSSLSDMSILENRWRPTLAYVKKRSECKLTNTKKAKCQEEFAKLLEMFDWSHCELTQEYNGKSCTVTISILVKG
jgi:hypothetical protein